MKLKLSVGRNARGRHLLSLKTDSISWRLGRPQARRSEGSSVLYAVQLRASRSVPMVRCHEKQKEMLEEDAGWAELDRPQEDSAPPRRTALPIRARPHIM